MPTNLSNYQHNQTIRTRKNVRKALENAEKQNKTFKSITNLAVYIADEVGVSKSLVMRNDAPYRDMLTEYQPRLVNNNRKSKTAKTGIPSTLEAMQIRLSAAEHKVENYELILAHKESQEILAPTSETLQSNSYQYEFEKICQLVRILLDHSLELEITGSKIVTIGITTGLPETIADKEHTKAYIEWRNGKKRVFNEP